MQLTSIIKYSTLIILINSFILLSQNATRVYVGKIEKKVVSNSIEVVGTIEFPEISNVASEVSGKVDKVFIDDGQRVKKGEIIVQLNSDLLDKEIEVAKANYLAKIQDFELKKWHFDRLDTLFKSGDIPQKDLKERNTQYIISQYELEKAKADLEKLELLLKKKSIVSPFDGVVIDKLVSKGDWVDEGKPVAIIASDSKVDVVCNAPQDLISNLSKGNEVDVIFNKSKIQGKITSIVPKGNINTRTFPVKIRLNNTDQQFMDGMEVKVKLMSGKQRNSFIVQRDAVVTKNDRSFIYVVENSKALEIPVEVISYQGLNVEIASDQINTQMQVVIRGNQFLSTGQLLEIVK